MITGKPDDLYITHYDVGEILASVQRAGIAAPPWLTAIILRIAGAVRRVPGLRDLAERRRSPPSSSSTGSTTCSWR